MTPLPQSTPSTATINGTARQHAGLPRNSSPPTRWLKGCSARQGSPEAHFMTTFVIFNADDFGQAPGINQGILECHARGVVTSASLMVTGHAIAEAVSMSRDHPRLSLGLHWDVWGEDEREFDITNVGAVKDELRRQIDEFERVVGRLPTHVDSHRHAHREPRLMPIFRELVEPLGIPLRGDGKVRFVGGFYAQWQWGVTNLEYVSAPFLERMLR